MNWSEFRTKWKDCQQCELGKLRSNIVLAKGNIPCDILFIGEAPGVSEDTLGVPFVGPAGRLLHSLVDQSLELVTNKPRIAWTNLVACLPMDSEKREPSKNEIKACSGRLQEFVKLVKPRGIVRVGRLSTKHALQPKSIRTVDVIHPAYLLRSQEPQLSLGCNQTIVRIRTLAAELGFK